MCLLSRSRLAPHPEAYRFSQVGRPQAGLRIELARPALGPACATIVHDHGVWLPWNHAVAATARSHRVPYIVSPRGMLEPWSLQHHRLRKRAAWYLYQRRDLRLATALHATAPSEAEQFRRLGLRQPIVVLPNGVDLPPAMPARRLSPGGPRRALFLSRIHPKKGLLNLVAAWSAVRPVGWEMAIAGPDEGGHEAEVRAAVAAAGLGDCFRFIGDQSDSTKWSVYRSAELFILPTHSENFGVVVAEALAAGVPVITTRCAPWALLEEERCGWWVPDTVPDLERALSCATPLSASALRTMGDRGASAVRERFAWDSIGERMAHAYRWLLGLDARAPECVVA